MHSNAIQSASNISLCFALSILLNVIAILSSRSFLLLSLLSVRAIDGMKCIKTRERQAVSCLLTETKSAMCTFELYAIKCWIISIHSKRTKSKNLICYNLFNENVQLFHLFSRCIWPTGINQFSLCNFYRSAMVSNSQRTLFLVGYCKWWIKIRYILSFSIAGGFAFLVSINYTQHGFFPALSLSLCLCFCLLCFWFWWLSCAYIDGKAYPNQCYLSFGKQMSAREFTGCICWF